ncbi:MAG: phospholipase D-like domain-containing protein [Planctomycetota bacterium]
MSDLELADKLRQTLEDHRLSRGERRVLAEIFEETLKDERERAIARHQAFELARKELSDSPNANVIEWLEDVNKLLLPPSEQRSSASEAHFSPSDHCVSRIIRLFEQSQKSADICVFTITDDRIKDAILRADKRGIAIRVISDNHKATDLGSDVDELRRRGVPVRVDQTEYHMHHKFAIFDDRELLTGSYNWTRSAAAHNEENFVITGDPGLVRSFQDEFDKLWKQLA